MDSRPKTMPSKSQSRTSIAVKVKKSTTTVATSSTKRRGKRRRGSDESRRLRPKVKASAAWEAKRTAAAAAIHRERLTKCSSFVVPPKSNRYNRLYNRPAFSELHARLKVASNLGRNYSVVDLVTPADQQTIRCAFTRTVATCIFSLLLFTALTMALFAELLPAGYLNWPGVLQSLAATMILCLLVSLFAYWTNFDFTALFNVCFLSLLAVVLLVAIVLYGAVGSQPMRTIFEVVVTVFLLFFLAMTTQMIVGGDGRLWVMPTTRYIRAALTLYAEIMALYFYMPGVRLVK